MPRFIDIDGDAPIAAADEARAAIGATSLTDVADQIAAEDIPGQVTAAVAAASTVLDAAADAVVDAAAGLDIALASDERFPVLSDPDTFRVRDITGASVIQVTPDGDAIIGDTTFRAAGKPYSGFRVMDSENALAFDVRPDGSVFVGQFASDSDGGGYLVDRTVAKVHVLIGAGQSNMSGRGEPTDAELDPEDARIFQFGSGATQITQATVPLDMVDVPAGLSPITVIARDYLLRVPDNEVVLIIPAAKGASVLGTDTTESVNGVWNVAYAGASTDLYALMIAQIDAALAAAAAKWVNADINTVGLFWNQGEANSATATADYETRFDAIVADLRSHLSDSDLPVVIGGMTPEYIAATSGLENIEAAHIDTPSRVTRTAYAPGIPNASIEDADQVHYHRDGVKELGHRMLLAWDRALLNETGLEQHPPMSVSAQIVGGVLTVEWELPPCRYTGFVVEYDEGGGWTAITHSDVSTTATKSGLTAPVQVRVSTVNEEGTSYTTAPIYADYKG